MSDEDQRYVQFEEPPESFYCALGRVVAAFADLDGALSSLLDALFRNYTAPSVSVVDSEAGKALRFEREPYMSVERLIDGESTEWKFSKCISVLQEPMPFTDDEIELLRTNVFHMSAK